MDWSTRQPYSLGSSAGNRNSRFYKAEKPQRDRMAQHTHAAPVSSTPQPHYRSLGNVLDITDESMLDSDSITGAFCDDEADEFDPVFRARCARLNGAGDYADDMAYTRSLPRAKIRDKYRDCCATPRLVRRNDNTRKPMMFSDDSSDMSSSITDDIDDALTLQKSRQTKLHCAAPTTLPPGRRYAKKPNATNVSGTSSSGATHRSTPSSFSRLGNQSPSVTRMARSQSPSTIGSVRSPSPSILKSARSPSPSILKTARSPSPSILKTARTQSPAKLTGRQFRETARESTQLPATTRTSYSSMFRGQQQAVTPSSKVVSSDDSRSRTQLRDKSGDRSLDSDPYRSREKSRDRIQASTSSSRARTRTREKSEERMLESSRVRTREKSGDRMLDRARNREKSRDRLWDSSTTRAREKSADRILTSSMVKAGEESAERMLTGTTARSRGKSSDRMLPSNAVRARGKSGDRIVDDSRVRARAKSGGPMLDTGNKPIESGRNGGRIGGDRAREREKSWDRLLDNSRTRGRDKSGNRMLGGDRAKSRERLDDANSRRTRTESGRWLDDESTWDVGSQLSPISPISHAVLPQPFSSKARAVAKVTAPSSIDDNCSRSRQSSEQQLSDEENQASDQEDASELVNVNETKSYSYCEVMLHDDNDASSKVGRSRRRQWSTSGAALSGMKYKHNSKSTPSLYTSMDEHDDSVSSPVNLSPSIHDSRSPQSQQNHTSSQSHDYESPSHDYRSPSRDYGSCDALSSPSQDVRSMSRNAGVRLQNTTNTTLRRTPLSRSFRQQWQYKQAAVVDRGKKPSPSSFEKLGQSLCKSLSPSAIFDSLDNNSEENQNKTSTPKRTAITSSRSGLGKSAEVSVATKVDVRSPGSAHRNNTEQSRMRTTIISPRTNNVNKIDQFVSDSKGGHSWHTPREPHDTGSSSEDQIAKALPVSEAAHGNAMPDIMSKGAILGRNRDKSENWILCEDGQPVKDGGRSKSKMPSKPIVLVDRVTSNPLFDNDRPFSPFTPSQKRSSQSSCDDNNNAASVDNQKDIPVSPLGIVLFGSKTLFGSKAMVRGLPPPRDASSESEEEAAVEQQQVAPRVDFHNRDKRATPPSGQSGQQQSGYIKKSGASTYYPRRRTIDVILAEGDDEAAGNKLSPRARLYKDTTVASPGDDTHRNERRGETDSSSSREPRLYTRRETLAKSCEELDSSDSSGKYSSPRSRGILKHSYEKPKTFEAHNGSGPSWLDSHNRGQLRKTFAKSCEQLDTSPNSWDRNGNVNESNFARSRSVRELQQRNRANSKSNLSSVTSANQPSAQSYVNSLPRRKSTTPPTTGTLSSGRFRRLTEGGDYYGLSQENLADDAVFTDRNWSDKENGDGGSKACNGEGQGDPEFLMYL